MTKPSKLVIFRWFEVKYFLLGEKIYNLFIIFSRRKKSCIFDKKSTLKMQPDEYSWNDLRCKKRVNLIYRVVLDRKCEKNQVAKFTKMMQNRWKYGKLLAIRVSVIYHQNRIFKNGFFSVKKGWYLRLCRKLQNRKDLLWAKGFWRIFVKLCKLWNAWQIRGGMVLY